MTETIESMATQIDQQQLARDLVAAARADGVELDDPCRVDGISGRGVRLGYARVLAGAFG